MHPTTAGDAATGRVAAALPRLLATAGDPSLAAHARRWGLMPGAGPALLDEIERSGLQGRGGAAFPTARKIRAVGAGRRTAVVANGLEREPLSMKDRTLLVNAPHLVLDGASIAAAVVGAPEVIVGVDRSAPGVIAAVEAAIRERAAASADRVTFRVEAAPGRYVSGEESALIHWLNGGDARPTSVPPRPFERGVHGRPTLVNNVETLAHLALIARFGARWFASLGTPDSPGTALITVSGQVARPGVFEVPLGIPLSEALEAADATRAAGAVQAVLIGGYFGTWVPGDALPSLRLSPGSLRAAGASFGCGALFALGPGSCGLAETARVTRWLAGQSAGQCGPCVNGLPAIATAVEGLVAGDRDHACAARLHRWTRMVEGRGACRHPDGVVHFVRSALQVFAGEIEAHRQLGPCRAAVGALPTPDLGPGWR
jgi:NADH:ubiquinone oxidoreductase subunit F (NADH-binding)